MNGILSMRMHTPTTVSIGGATFDLFLGMNADALHACNNKTLFAFELGHKIRIDHVHGTFGGGAHNTAVGLRRLGCVASFSGVIGADHWGKLMLDNMKQEGVDTSSVAVVEHEQSSFSVILLSEHGERTILSHKGMDRHLHDITFDREKMARSTAIYLNHIHEDSCEIQDDIVAALARTPQAHLTWNPGGCQIEEGLHGKNNRLLLPHTDLLLLNKEEALAFTNTTDVLAALRMLKASGTGIVAISDGPNGSLATDGDTVWHCPAISCDVVDSTGAGDAFGTGMTWAILTGRDLPTALRAGTINATSVVGAYGAQTGLLTDTQMQSQLDHALIDCTRIS